MTESIGNLNELQAMRSIVNGGLNSLDYILAADIDISSVTDWTPIGTPGSKFSGSIDGRDYKISGLTIIGSGDYKALFGYGYYADFIDLDVVDANIRGDDYLAVLVAYDYRSSYVNCWADGAITGGNSAQHIGLWSGYGNGSDYSGSVCSGAVNCGNYCRYIGGGIGRTSGCTIQKCYSTVIISTGYNSYEISGIVGESGAGTTIADSYSDGGITTGSNCGQVGGIVGWHASGCNIIRCHAVGAVSGTTDVGALAGRADGTVTDSYYNSTTTGQGGAGTAVADIDYTKKASFPALDFDTVWCMGDNGPILQGPKPEIAKKLTFVISTDRICKPHGFFMIG